MANRRTFGGWMTAAAALAVAGCGFPHDRYGGDPLLGSFNRPIAPTPAIWTGGDPGFSPAYDGGAHIGLPSPDVPANASPGLQRMFIVPTFQGGLGLDNVFRGGSSAGGTSGGIERVSAKEKEARPTGRKSAPASVGARLSPGLDVAAHDTFTAGHVAPHAGTVTARPHDGHHLLTSGAAIVPSGPPAAPPSTLAAMKDPRAVASVEEAQTILQACGAKAQVMEQQPTGEWRFVCTMGFGEQLRRYEAKSPEQLDAVRAVMLQVKKEQ